MLRQLADDPRVGDIVESPPRWDAGLRLLGGVHNLVLTGRASWDRVEDALVDERDFLRRFVSEQRVQTNEVQRCWALLPCFLEAARRLDASTVDLIELGTSAGLLLLWDRYRYRYDAGEWGPEDAALELSAEERGRVPGELLARELVVRDRVGLDLEPVDVTTDEGALLLRSFVWADRIERIERLDRAIDALRADSAGHRPRETSSSSSRDCSSGGVRTRSRSCSRSLRPDTSTSRAGSGSGLRSRPAAGRARSPTCSRAIPNRRATSTGASG